MEPLWTHHYTFRVVFRVELSMRSVEFNWYSHICIQTSDADLSATQSLHDLTKPEKSIDERKPGHNNLKNYSKLRANYVLRFCDQHLIPNVHVD